MAIGLVLASTPVAAWFLGHAVFHAGLVPGFVALEGWAPNIVEFALGNLIGLLVAVAVALAWAFAWWTLLPPPGRPWPFSAARAAALVIFAACGVLGWKQAAAAFDLF